jgi:hypothetical protein
MATVLLQTQKEVFIMLIDGFYELLDLIKTVIETRLEGVLSYTHMLIEIIIGVLEVNLRVQITELVLEY